MIECKEMVMKFHIEPGWIMKKMQWELQQRLRKFKKDWIRAEEYNNWNKKYTRVCQQ